MTHGLYTLNPLFEGRKRFLRVLFHKILHLYVLLVFKRRLYSRAGYVCSRHLIKFCPKSANSQANNDFFFFDKTRTRKKRVLNSTGATLITYPYKIEGVLAIQIVIISDCYLKIKQKFTF